ncbi:MAG: Rossmann-like and DUF2520 domain-containing protein [Anaerobutyricum sp.]|nr:Rossmann-like and DUF2520 domain-containing protein [Anaerobutyricum sp.]
MPEESRVMIMKTGMIGAGKVGCSLGKYLRSNGLEITGYYDKNQTFAKEAADFTGTSCRDSLEEIVNESDTLFLTVPDDLILSVWNQIKDMPLQGKFICHCSGAMSAGDAFPGIDSCGAFGYSVHPLFAVSDKYSSYKELSNAYFVIEGNREHREEIAGLFQSLGNEVRFIKAEDKVKYHCAAAICSNHVVALIEESLTLMKDCGFDEESARRALAPIMLGNMKHIIEGGTAESLTGPVERADIKTVKKHLSCLDEDQRKLYCLLSEILVSIGERKNPRRDYEPVMEVLSSGARQRETENQEVK